MADEKGTKGKKDITVVDMDDGRKVEFAGSRNMLKQGVLLLNDGAAVDSDEASSEQRAHGQPAIRLDFRNGKTRTYPIRKDMILDFAIHGGKQKYGDELAGHKSDDPDDWVEDLDSLHKQLYEKGDWRTERVPGTPGISVLIKALMEYNEKKGTPKTIEQIRAFLDGKKPQEKEALKHTERLRPIVARLEEERRAKLAKVDADALLGELDAA